MKERIEVLRRLYRNRWANKPKLEGVTLSKEEQSLLDQMKANGGIVIIPNFMSAEEVQKLREFIDNRLSQFSSEEEKELSKLGQQKEYITGVPQSDGTKIWIDKYFADKRIVQVEAISAFIKERFADKESFVKIGSSYLQLPITHKWTMANRIEYREANAGSGGGWHRDQIYSLGFKSLVYLIDTTEDNGCFQYIPFSSSLWHHLLKTPIVDKYQYTDEDIKEMVGGDYSKIMNVTGKAGTLVLFDTNCVHRGAPLKQGSRYAITNYYNEMK